MEFLRRVAPLLILLALSACRSGPLLVLLALAACRSGPPQALPAHELRERLAGIEAGQTLGEVRAAIGALPVLRPGHPESPFPTPLRAMEWRSPAGERIRVEVYVVAVRPAHGCPDVQYDDSPLAFVNERVVATQWDALEWRWRGWGGALAGLRSLQDRFGCDEEAVAR